MPYYDQQDNYAQPAQTRPIDTDPDYGDDLQNQAANQETRGDTADMGADPMGPGMHQEYGPLKQNPRGYGEGSEHNFRGYEGVS